MCNCAQCFRFATIFACPFLFYFIFAIVRIILISLAMHPEYSVTYYTENFYPGRLLTQIWLRLSLHGLRTILLKISFCPHLRLCKALIWWVFRATFLSFLCRIFCLFFYKSKLLCHWICTWQRNLICLVWKFDPFSNEYTQLEIYSWRKSSAL